MVGCKRLVKRLNEIACWTLLLIEQCRCNVSVQQALTLSYKGELIWQPHKTPKVHRVGGYSEVIKVRRGEKHLEG